MRRMFSLEQLKGIADSRVQALVEGGTLENAKPIYWHGLELYKSNSSIMYCHILSNTSEKYDTLTKFINWIKSFDEKVIIQCNGQIDYDNERREILAVYKANGSNNINFMLSDATNVYKIYYDVDLNSTFSAINDEMNKIN